MTKWQLFSALALDGNMETNVVTGMHGVDGNVRGVVLAIERESGDGRSFNVRMQRIGESGLAYTASYFVRTID